MSFLGGSIGVIYRQFSITLVAAMALSLIVALILTPALCALILKPNPQPQRWAVWFNQKIEQLKINISSLFRRVFIIVNQLL